jgi:hypothetical protein
MYKKLLLIGHARAGKDTVAEMLKELFGYTFESSSMAAARIFLYDALKDKYEYKSPNECFEDRVNRRSEWFDLICQYNEQDKARLAKAIMSESDMYVGMRSNAELEACLSQNVFDLVIGVYNPNKPLEPASSFDIDFWGKADVVIPNGGTLEDLRNKVALLKPLLIN